MRSWHDEWKHAQLRLRLRDDELFHGESVALFVEVRVPSDSSSTLTTSSRQQANGDANAPASPTAALSLSAAAAALRQRWKKHCESARVDIRVVEESGTPTKPKAPRTTLFHQDAQLELVDGAGSYSASASDSESARDHASSNASTTLVFRSEMLLKVRSEYWHRPLKLLVRVTPLASVASGPAASPSALDYPLALTNFFTEQLQHDHVLRLIREETMAPEPLTRSIERQICVAKPLQLKMETRYLSKERVCIIAKASNAHASLELKILDLHLHLNESYSTSEPASARTRSGQLRSSAQSPAPATATRRPQRQFRIVNDAQEQFPIRISSAEQFNFLFILEAVEAKDTVAEGYENGEEDGGNDDTSDSGSSRFGNVQEERAASMSKHRAPTGGAMKRHSSSGVISAGASVGVSSLATTSAKRTAGAAQTQQTLLTLSWEACTPASGSISSGERRVSPPITEYHTIIWSPQSLSTDMRREQTNLWAAASTPLAASAYTELVASSGSSEADGVSTVRLSKQCPLSMSLAPLSASSQQSIRVGEVVTLCLVIANRSQHTNFDLTLLSPFAQEPSGAAAASSQQHHQAQRVGAGIDDARTPGWLSFEATHRLGVVPPGLTVRKSVRVVFLRAGKCDLNRFALFDRLSRSCFVPPIAAAACSSASATPPACAAAAHAWEIFVS